MWRSIFTYCAICTNEGFAVKTNTACVVLATPRGAMENLLSGSHITWLLLVIEKKNTVLTLTFFKQRQIEKYQLIFVYWLASFSHHTLSERGELDHKVCWGCDQRLVQRTTWCHSGPESMWTHQLQWSRCPIQKECTVLWKSPRLYLNTQGLSGHHHGSRDVTMGGERHWFSGEAY